MKILFILSIILIFLTGCSSYYTVKQFPSRKEFYEDFNKSVNEKPLKIFMMSDSSITAPNGAEILNDSLLFSRHTQKEKIILLKNKIKNIQYYFNKSNSTYSASIILNSGEILNEDNVELLPDSSISYGVDKFESLPLNKIKKVSCKNNELGTVSGFLIGSVSGFIAGLITTYILTVNNHLTPSSPSPIIYMPIIGCIIGTILGGVQGYKYTYQFNP